MSQNLEYLSILDESEEERYNSRAVFSGIGVGVEVEEYDGFNMYEWETEKDFSEVLEELEPFHPLTQDPALEMVREKGRVRNADRDHVTMSNEYVYDPVREWREEDRWGEYSLIQVNLTGGKLVYDEKGQSDGRIRVYSMDESSDMFENMFPRTVDTEDSESIVEDVKEIY